MEDLEIATTTLDLRPLGRSSEGILAALRDARIPFDLLFVHADGKGQPEQAFQRHVEPLAQGLQQDGEGTPACVGIVPVHETEAWMLADPGGLRRALKTSKSADELELPALHEIERLAEPKGCLRAACKRARGNRRARSRRQDKVPARLLGELVSLESLRSLSAFTRFERDLERALRSLQLASREDNEALQKPAARRSSR